MLQFNDIIIISHSLKISFTWVKSKIVIFMKNCVICHVYLTCLCVRVTQFNKFAEFWTSQQCVFFSSMFVVGVINSLLIVQDLIKITVQPLFLHLPFSPIPQLGMLCRHPHPSEPQLRSVHLSDAPERLETLWERLTSLPVKRDLNEPESSSAVGMFTETFTDASWSICSTIPERQKINSCLTLVGDYCQLSSWKWNTWQTVVWLQS